MDRLYNKYFFLMVKMAAMQQCKFSTPLLPKERGLPSPLELYPPPAHTHLEPVDLGLGLQPSSSLSTFHFLPLALKLIKNPDSKATAY